MKQKFTEFSEFTESIKSMCLAGAVVASWSLTQDVAGSNPLTVIKNILVTECIKFNESFKENSNFSSSVTNSSNSF